MPVYSLAHLTVLGCAPPQVVEIAARCDIGQGNCDVPCRASHANQAFRFRVSRVTLLCVAMRNPPFGVQLASGRGEP